MRPGLLVFVVALLASLSVHLPVYQVLGVLAEAILPPTSRARPEPTTIEFEIAADDEGTPPKQDPAVERVAERTPTLEPEPKVVEPKPRLRARARPRQAPSPPQVPKPRVPPPRKVVPPPPANKLSVLQKSDDPDVEPPPDAQFLAQENRRVVEETVARTRNLQKDDPSPQSAATVEQTDSDNEGTEAEAVVADLQDVKGDDTRQATAEEAMIRPEQSPEPVGAGSREGQSLPSRASAAARASQAQANRGVKQTGGEERTIVINDGHGTLVIRQPKVGRGPGQGGDTRPVGERALRPGQRARASGRAGTDLRISYRQFEQTFGAEELARQRAAFAAQTKSKARGGSRTKRWRRFKAAIENYVSKVKSGDQTALNAAASPFAAYLAAVHRRIHSEYALGFLRNLPLAGGPFDDADLHTKLEIIINKDGTLHQVGVLQTSGLLPFDFGAFDAVMRAGPFARPPRQILSGDDRVYVHWGFYRNMRQCGTFNASPFILRNPAGIPSDSQTPDPLRDRPGIPPRNRPDSEWGMAPWNGGRRPARPAVRAATSAANGPHQHVH